MAGFCEHGKELSDCIKSEEFLDRGPTLVSASCRQIACKRKKKHGKHKFDARTRGI